MVLRNLWSSSNLAVVNRWMQVWGKKETCMAAYLQHKERQFYFSSHEGH